MSGRSWKTKGLTSAERKTNMRYSCIRSEGGRILLRHDNLVGLGMNLLGPGMNLRHEILVGPRTQGV